ncbi:MAG: right-handed parallel beta-helix repeat-containing protein, partial [bacterium]|nr:right-handed parallel beta-helix repeat-containing protein [bacterium]
QHLVKLNGKHYLVEGVPYSWLTTATLPVTIDYELRSGGISGNETWLSGKTYYVSGPVTVNNGYTLVIRGNAIVKFAGNGQINVASGAKIIAWGSKFNYVLFTSTNDDSVGETTPHGQGSPYYPWAIQLQSGSSEWSRIRYCKIRYAGEGIIIRNNLVSSNQIQNNVIRDGMGTCGIRVTGNAVLKNNLIVYPGTFGVLVISGGTAIIQLNTIEGGWNGIRVESNSYASVTDTLISNATYSLYSSSNCTLNHNYNFFYRAPLGPGISLAANEQSKNDEVDNPFEISANGAYYLKQNTNLCMDRGSINAQAAGMQGKTTKIPTAITENITAENNTWNKVARDAGVVDIGYHYDPVDIIIKPTSSNNLDVAGSNVSLAIDSGVVVSFYRENSSNQKRLRIRAGAQLFAVGCDTAFIQFTSLYATSDLIQSPFRGGLDVQDYTGVYLRDTANRECNLQFCEFQYARYGLRIYEDLNLNRPIQNNIFQQNLYGLVLHHTLNAVNNQFMNNRYGVSVGNYALFSQYGVPNRMVSYIQSNTFYANDTAVWVKSDVTGKQVIVRIENNIITSNLAGCIGQIENSGILQAETRNNLYWNNELNVDGTSILVNNSNTENKDIINDSCPMLVHKARLSANERIIQYPQDGFYLAQRSGDASRFPFRQYDLVNIDVSGLTEGMEMGNFIRVYASNSYNSETLLGSYYRDDVGYTYGDGEVNWGNILIELDGYWKIYSGDYITLTFAFGGTVHVYLPQMYYAEGQFHFWVAQDGSSYYSRSDRGVGNPNQDAYFAMQWDMPNITGKNQGDTGLAMSAYDGRYARYGNQAQARSPAVDKGAVKVTPAIVANTNQDVNYTLFASLGWTNTEDTNSTTRDSQTTIRVIPAQISPDHTDPIGRLDLGYHYRNGVTYVTEAFGLFTAVVNPGTSEATTLIFYPYHYNASYLGEQNDITSGLLNISDLNHTSVVAFAAQGSIPRLGYADEYNALGFHEANTPITRVVQTAGSVAPSVFPPTPWIGFNENYCTSVDAGASPSTGTTFIVCAARSGYFEKDDGKNYDHVWIRVYRYDSATKEWHPVASLAEDWEQYGPTAGWMWWISDLAIAADDSTVWIAFRRDHRISEPQQWDRYEYDILATFVPSHSYTPLSAVDFDVIKYWEPSTETITAGLDMTFDEKILPAGDVRLVYKNENDQVISLRCETRRTEHRILPIEETIVSVNETGERPRIAYNPNDPTGDTKR